MHKLNQIPGRAKSRLSDFFSSREVFWWMGFLLLAAVLSIFTVYDQVYHRVGEKFIWDEQLRFQRWVIEGTSVDPWQYRIFVPYLIDAIHEIAIDWGFIGDYLKIFFGLRLIQNFLIFIMVALYFRRLSIKHSQIVIAVIMLAWAFTYSGYQSHLGFDTYFDILFYLLAAYLLLKESLFWIIPLSILVAFNRETGLFIPLIVIVGGMQFRPRLTIERKHVAVGLISLVLMVGIIISVRLIYGPRAFLHIAIPGWDLFVRNITSFDTYFYWFATFSAIPVIALLRYKQWPRLLVQMLWLMVPVWVVIHFFMGVAYETRLFLVPFVLIFLPGLFICSSRHRSNEEVLISIEGQV
jgi:hypothetical protein